MKTPSLAPALPSSAALDKSSAPMLTLSKHQGEDVLMVLAERGSLQDLGRGVEPL